MWWEGKAGERRGGWFYRATCQQEVSLVLREGLTPGQRNRSDQWRCVPNSLRVVMKLWLAFSMSTFYRTQRGMTFLTWPYQGHAEAVFKDKGPKSEGAKRK